MDLYYHSGDQHFIRIGSPEDTVRRYVVLNERLRNVPRQELLDTAGYLYQQEGRGGGSASEFTTGYINNTAKTKTWIGRYSWLMLPSSLRTLTGPKVIPSGVDPLRAIASTQTWYGEYSIPSDVYVVPQGTDLAAYGVVNRLDEKSSVFLKHGFIVVNFNIETIQDGRLDRPHLQYIHAPLMNQWRLEGFAGSYRDPYGYNFLLKDGDTLFYHADLSSRGDFTSQVPH
ncbi:hypothetical protein [Paenibacillus lemnae]|uniref:Uncharacterized protein n=1 Tax=Paenibacillus lemnae TaxID=1330551 RepID=A0A848M406_PAELE|nr:hypothetical protein [Paenibacillus lemnae]NMO95677.1 hypothetical protein [Paenibacillus lemnae]